MGWLECRIWGCASCAFGPSETVKGNVQVFVGHDNARELHFDDVTGIQTAVKCKGERPPSCDKSAHDRDCGSFECPCDVDTSSLSFPYMARMVDVVLPMCSQANEARPFRVLLIGVGGGAQPGHILSRCPGNTSVESVESDPRIIEAAVKFFGLRPSPANVVENADGGQAVQDRLTRGSSYDVVLVDAFEAGGTVPDSCRGEAFIAGVKAILKQGGKAVQHIWSPQYGQTLNDYRAAFGEDNVESVDLTMGTVHLIVATKERRQGEG